MSLPERTKVLIVGAGPTGLATALSLLHHDFHDFVIVDAVQEGENTSRAIVVHAATLEALDTIGCGDDLVAQGTKATRLCMGTRAQCLISPCMTSLKTNTRHPYALIVPQCLTERTLQNKLESLGGVVQRSVKATTLRRGDSEPGSESEGLGQPRMTEVVFEDGRVVKAAYVIGADGSRSVVRAAAGINFQDPRGGGGGGDDDREASHLDQMVLADVTFDAPIASLAAEMPFSGTMSPEGFFLCVALPPTCNDYLAAAHTGTGTGESLGTSSSSDQIFRIGCGLQWGKEEEEQGEERSQGSPGSKQYMQNCVDKLGPYQLSSDPAVNPSGKPVHIKDVIWSSQFRNYAAIADKTFTRFGSVDEGEQQQVREGDLGKKQSGSASELEEGGVILLVGDAAHIHSPAGGQGMNLGIRDAIFLGEAIIKHIEATTAKSVAEADAILREFAENRHARALEVIALTKTMLSIAGMKGDKDVSWLLPVSWATVRDWAIWIAGCIPFVRRRFAWELSGLGRR